jgi:1-acyl-sn-glycerol-3-phosphate acyltransferase
MYPRYPYPPSRLWPLIRDWALNHPRDFQQDARTFTALLGEGLQVTGMENVVSDRPMVVVMNHYSRPGFGMWWLVVAIAAQMPRNPHLIMTNELTRWLGPVGNRFSRWLLPRIARTYGFSPMPPMPPRSQDVNARAASVREVLSYITHTDLPLLMIAPEGRDNLEGGSLAKPPAGSGRFLLLLASKRLSILPVGGWEANKALQVRFGRVFELFVPKDLSAREKDRLASERVMTRIAELLPAALQGEFGSTLAGAV